MKIKVLSKSSTVGAESFEYAPGFIFAYDASCFDYDWLVVFDEIPEGSVGTVVNGCVTLPCPREQTILATWEPTSIKCYSRAYAKQFGHLLSNRPWAAEKHPNYHLGRGYYPWLNDRTYPENVSVVIPPKTKLLSAVCSAKSMKWTKHHARIRLLKKLVAEVPGSEWYGHDVRSFGKKFEVMDSYKYHVAIENHIGEHYWTEKIADAFLCECLPFYAGAPDLADDFPAESFIPIPIDDPDEAIRIIKSSIESDEYSKRREAVLEAKRLVLGKFNFWAQVIDVIKSAQGQKTTPVDPARPAKLYSRKTIRRRCPSAALEALFFHARQYMPRI